MSVPSDYMDVVTQPTGDGTTVENGIETVTTTATRLPNWALIAAAVGLAYLAFRSDGDDDADDADDES